MGATAVGVTDVSRLPRVPSADTDYLMAGARSVVSVMVHYDDGIVEDYLAKANRKALQRHETELYRKLDRIARGIAELLGKGGARAVPAQPNLDYRYKNRAVYRLVPHNVRQTLVDWLASDSVAPVQGIKRALVKRLYAVALRTTGWRLTPGFAHRYGAVASGLGELGWSGNVLHPDHGARVLFNSVLTDAVLESDEVLPEKVCDGCRLCVKSCQSGYVLPKEKAEVEIGGEISVHNRKASNLRCILVCGGFSGQSRFPKWSTWSEGRVRLPGDDADLQQVWDHLIVEPLGKRNHASTTLSNLLFHSEYGYIRNPVDRFRTTCGYCQFVCAAAKEKRRRLYSLLSTAGGR